MDVYPCALSDTMLLQHSIQIQSFFMNPSIRQVSLSLSNNRLSTLAVRTVPFKAIATLSLFSKRVRQQRISQHFVCTAPCAVRQARGKKFRKNWSDTSNTQGLLGLVAFWPNSKLRSALLASLRVGGNSKEA